MRYAVRLPLTAALGIIFESDTEMDEQEAIDYVLDNISMNIEIENSNKSKIDCIDMDEWEVHREVVKGNVFYGICRCRVRKK